MTRNFHNIFTRVGVRGKKKRYKYFVNNIIVFPDRAEMNRMGGCRVKVFAFEYFVNDCNCLLTGNTNNTDRSFAGRRGYGNDRVLITS